MKIILNGYTICYLQDGRTIEGRYPLKKWFELLNPQVFVRIHASYIVNLAQVHSIKTQNVILKDQVELPISRGRSKDVKNAYRLHCLNTIMNSTKN